MRSSEHIVEDCPRQSRQDTSARLIQWKKRADEKRVIQVELNKVRRRQEENFFISQQSKVLLKQKVEAASKRNYQVAELIAWKRLHMKTQQEQEVSQSEKQNCFFRPRLFKPKSAQLAAVKARYLEEPTTTKMVKADKSRDVSSTKSTSNEVFDRLYAPEKHRNQKDKHKVAVSRSGSACADVSSQACLRAFLERQEQNQKAHEDHMAQLAREHACSFTPELSEQTQKLCEYRRYKTTEELLELDRVRRLRKLERCIGPNDARTVCPVRVQSGSSGKIKQKSSRGNFQDKQEDFQALLITLQAQEQRMRAREQLSSAHLPTPSSI